MAETPQNLSQERAEENRPVEKKLAPGIMLRYYAVTGRVDDALELVEQTKMPLEEAQAVIKEALPHCMERRDYKGAFEIANRFGLSQEALQTIIKPELINQLRGNIAVGFVVKKAIPDMRLTKEFLKDSEIQAAAAEILKSKLDSLSFFEISSAEEVVGVFYLPNEIVWPIAKEAIIKLLSVEDHNSILANAIVQLFHLPADFLKSSGIEDLVKHTVTVFLRTGEVKRASELVYYFSTAAEELFKEKDIRELIEKSFAGWLKSSREVESLFRIMDFAGLPEDFFQKPEVQEGAKEAMEKNITIWNNIDSALDIAERLEVPEEAVQSVGIKVTKWFLSRLPSEDVLRTTAEIVEKIDLPEAFFKNAENQSQVEKHFNDWVAMGTIEAIKIARRFYLPDLLEAPNAVFLFEQDAIRGLKISSEMFFEIFDQNCLPKDFFKEPWAQEAAREAISDCLKRGQTDSVLKLIKIFDIPELEEWFRENVRVAVREQLSNNQVGRAMEMVKKFHLPQEFIMDEKTQSVVRDKFFLHLLIGEIDEAGKLVKTFNLTDEFLKSPKVVAAVNSAFKSALEKNNFREALLLNREFKLGHKVLEKIYNDFGEYGNSEISQAYEQLEKGEIPESLRFFGVKDAGAKGINQLKQKLRKIQTNLLEGQVDFRLMTSPLVKQWVKTVINYDFSDWGDHDENRFDNKINGYFEQKAEYRPAPKEYAPSQILQIDKVEKEKQAEFKHTPDFSKHYSLILEQVKRARSLVNQEGDLENIFADIIKIRTEVLGRLEAQTVKIQSSNLPEKQKEVAIGDITKKRELLSSLDLNNLKLDQGPKEIFKILASFKEFNNALRTLVFYSDFKLNEFLREKDVADFSETAPSVEELGWVMNFVDHITNQQVYNDYFTDREALANFKSLLGISVLEQEMARMQNQKSKGSMSFQFVPARNLLTEFSGHIADACWADRYESVLKEFPNFVSLIMVQNPEKERSARLAGAALLIETVSKNDEPLLVIRGFNPKENTINQLSVEDFYQKTVDYLKPIAEKLGRKLAIVIDDHTGGATTNRPVLFTFLSDLKKNLTPVRLKSEKGTTFNDYDIRRTTFLVE